MGPKAWASREKDNSEWVLPQRQSTIKHSDQLPTVCPSGPEAHFHPGHAVAVKQTKGKQPTPVHVHTRPSQALSEEATLTRGQRMTDITDWDPMHSNICLKVLSAVIKTYEDRSKKLRSEIAVAATMQSNTCHWQQWKQLWEPNCSELHINHPIHSECTEPSQKSLCARQDGNPTYNPNIC